MNRWIAVPLMALALGGCALTPDHGQSADAPVMAADKVSMFSDGRPGTLPAGWAPMVIFKDKKRTDYQLIRAGDATVLRAYSDASSSGLMQHLNIDPFASPWLSWRWKIGHLNASIAGAHERMEDTPARLILGFDGDKGNLPFTEQILFETAKLVTGHDFPYATLMYEWHGDAPPETVRQSNRSSRIRTIIVDSGKTIAGQWREFSRNIVEDFERVYGEKPGRLIGIGVLTDSDNTGEQVETWYGDIQLLPNRLMANR